MSPSYFQHYKNGKIYLRLEIIKQELDWDDLVVYICMNDPEPRIKASRPAHEFYGFVPQKVMNSDGSKADPLLTPTKRRFQPIEEALANEILIHGPSKLTHPNAT